MEAHKILIVEDEVKIARFIELELVHEGYKVEVVNDGIKGYERGISNEFSLIILDLMLPEMSGVEVCRRIRRESEIPIIMLTAKDDIPDKVMGLDSGANDYMTKPFAIEELLARMRVLLKNKKNNILTSGKLVLDSDEYSVLYNNEPIMLTKKEFQLLEYLMKNRGRVLTRDQILETVWGYDYIGDTNVTDVYIRYLRSKIDTKYNTKLIHTIRGVGYIFKNEGENR